MTSTQKRFLHTISDGKIAPAAVSLLCVALSMLAAAVLLLVLGKSPVEALAAFLRGSGFIPKPSYAGGQNMLTDFLSFLGLLAPMILAALAFLTALKAGMFNIGIAGQMLASGFLATVIVGYSPLTGVLARPLVLLIGIVVGGLLGAAVGALKAKFNINEVVSTIMFNYIINYVAGFFINTYWADQISRSSKVCSAASRLTLTEITWGRLKPTIPLGILIALAAVFIIRFLLDKTTFGFELRGVGLNRDAARYSGIREGRVIVLGMTLSGALAGLAGVAYYLGYFNTILVKTLPSMGYDAIAVALLGNSNPMGSIFASALVTIFQKGAVYMSSRVKVPQEISSVIIGFMLLFSACTTFIRYYAKTLLDKNEAKGGQ